MLKSDSGIKDFLSHTYKKKVENKPQHDMFTPQYYNTIDKMMQSRSMVFMNPSEPRDTVYRFLAHKDDKYIVSFMSVLP